MLKLFIFIYNGGNTHQAAVTRLVGNTDIQGLLRVGFALPLVQSLIHLGYPVYVSGNGPDAYYGRLLIANLPPCPCQGEQHKREDQANEVFGDFHHGLAVWCCLFPEHKELYQQCGDDDMGKPQEADKIPASA